MSLFCSSRRCLLSSKLNASRVKIMLRKSESFFGQGSAVSWNLNLSKSHESAKRKYNTVPNSYDSKGDGKGLALGDLASTMQQQLERRKKIKTFRKPPLLTAKEQETFVDFSTNDYFGFARNPTFVEDIGKLVMENKYNGLGSTGSRLLTGNNRAHEDLEKKISSAYGEHLDCVLFSSGYSANLGVFGSIPQKDSVVIWDEQCHNSIRQGLKLSRCNESKQFAHNNIKSLKYNLATTPFGKGIIVVESVYSMDGSVCPLAEICDVADDFGAVVIVDEAHSTGLYGSNGLGLVEELELRHRVLATIHPFGKAVGFHGCAVLGPKIICEYLENFAHSYIYSTALPHTSLIALNYLFDKIFLMEKERQHISDLIAHFKREISQAAVRIPSLQYLDSATPIQGFIVPSNEMVLEASEFFKKRGFLLFPIRSPTVAAGTERLRIVLHSQNSKEEVTNLVATMEAFLESKRK